MLDPLYVEARRVLLDALDGLSAHMAAIVVVGAQAVYLHAGDGTFQTAPYTADGDLALDPGLLGAAPELEDAMASAGFRLREIGGHVEPGIWLASGNVAGSAVEIPVDLIVPEGVAPPGGRRGARLGEHGKRAARRISGLEAALVDRAPRIVRALGDGDARAHAVDVAGPAALMIAKAHKLAERAAGSRGDRLRDKDAVDVLRLMQATSPTAVAETMTMLKADPVAAASTDGGLRHLDGLFGRRGRPGIAMAARALRLAMPERRVETLCVAYVRALLADL